MSVEKKILSEIERYKSINRYLNEQGAPPPPDLGAAPPPPGGEPAPAGAPAPGGEPAVNVGAEPEPIDVEKDDDVEKIDEKGKSEEGKEDSEELEVTDLVKSQENIERPSNLKDLVSIAEALSGGIDFVRVDLYNVEGRVYFGEMTNYPSAGRGHYSPESFNLELGNFLKLDDTSKFFI